MFVAPTLVRTSAPRQSGLPVPGDLTFGRLIVELAAGFLEEAAVYTCEATGHICPTVKEGDSFQGILRIH